MPNMRRNKRETRSGGVCTISLSRNSLTPRLSYAACYTVIIRPVLTAHKFFFLFFYFFSPKLSYVPFVLARDHLGKLEMEK